MPNQDILRQRAERLGVPVIPARPTPQAWPKQPNDPNPTVGICGACGLELKRVMHYSCNRPDCPCFVQVTM